MLSQPARRINRLKEEACMLILSGYLPHAISPPDLLLLSYIRNNRGSIPNYGERYRQGETISTAYVESTINQVVSRRFVKKQQMERRDKPAWSRG